MFALYQILSLLIGVLMWTLIGQGLLALILGERRQQNFVYRFMAAITRPVLWLTRLVTPRLVLDRHLGWLALFLLLLLRVALYMFFYAQGWIPSISPGTPVVS